MQEKGGTKGGRERKRDRVREIRYATRSDSIKERG